MENISSQNEAVSQQTGNEQPVTKEQKANLEKKQDIITRLQALVSDQQGDLTETIAEFRKLQNEWKNIGDDIPQEKINELHKEYNRYQEQLYDLVKINNELREYDFKKNMELKTRLCEKAEELAQSEDVENAHKVLQNLHNEWKNIGPVAKEYREEIWSRFKAASDVIRERRAETLAAVEELNAKMDSEIREEKERLCSFVESINTEVLAGHKEWEKVAEEVKAANKCLLSRRLSDKEQNQMFFDRMRKACDAFFEAKSQFYAQRKAESQANLERKRDILKQMEELKESSDWKNATNKIVALQKEWWNIGPARHKTSRQLKDKFVAACDYFFERKKEALSDVKGEERKNLEKKIEIIEKIEKFEPSGNANNDFTTLKELQEEYRKIGFVPFKEKEKTATRFNEAINRQYDKVRTEYNINHVRNFVSDKEMLISDYERLKQEIATYENNLGFFSSSKKADSIVKTMEHKIQTLKQELEAIMEKINSLENQ